MEGTLERLIFDCKIVYSLTLRDENISLVNICIYARMHYVWYVWVYLVITVLCLSYSIFSLDLFFISVVIFEGFFGVIVYGLNFVTIVIYCALRDRKIDFLVNISFKNVEKIRETYKSMLMDFVIERFFLFVM